MAMVTPRRVGMIPIADPLIGNEELKNVIKAVRSGWISSKGKFIQEFEEEFAHFCGVKYGIAVSNGTAALHLALTALGIGQGDEVIIPTLTFIATANAVNYTGAKPVFVDSHPDYWCIDPRKIEKKITKRTKAIIPVHLYGHPCDMDQIMRIAKKYNLLIIEDSAEAHGAEYKGKRVSSFGEINCLSFYGNKIITTGEGGICLTNDKKLSKNMRILRDHGMDPGRRYWHEKIGFNYRMTNMQAAIGVAQMKRIEKLIEAKRKIAFSYNKIFKKIPGINIPPEMNFARSVYWMYSILLDDRFRMDRDKLMIKLIENGVECRPLFYPIHALPPYRLSEKFPIAEAISRRGISLPSAATLRKSDIEKICKIISNSPKATSGIL